MLATSPYIPGFQVDPSKNRLQHPNLWGHVVFQGHDLRERTTARLESDHHIGLCDMGGTWHVIDAGECMPHIRAFYAMAMNLNPNDLSSWLDGENVVDEVAQFNCAVFSAVDHLFKSATASELRQRAQQGLQIRGGGFDGKRFNDIYRSLCWLGFAATAYDFRDERQIAAVADKPRLSSDGGSGNRAVMVFLALCVAVAAGLGGTYLYKRSLKSS